MNSRAAGITIAGAMIGGVAAYLLFTDRGRALRREFEPLLEDYARELSSLRVTLGKAAGVASEGWKLLNEAMEQPNADGPYSIRHQHAPF